MLLTIQQVQQNDGSLFAIRFAENGIQILEWPFGNGDGHACFEQWLISNFGQPCLYVVDDVIGYGQRFIGKSDKTQHSPSRADSVPVVAMFAQVDEKVSRE